MRPLALTMQAFGPFAGREHVDFAMLGENPLFLIHGPTGAGKSSILDAICVALYGDTAGGERRAAQMRSHHAPDDRPTEVVFEFALGAERYRASRSPEQSRPSRRARDGFVTEPARAELSRWRDGRWQALAARPARLILDLTEVGYMDSSGVGTIVEAKRHADRQGGRVVLANLQARVRSVLEITQLDRFFVIAASLEAAREA